MIDTYKPERIIIEPSGVGKLSDIKTAVMRLPKTYELAIEYSVAVVDARKCKMYKRNYGEFIINQVASADSVVLSRTQSVIESKLEECVTIVRALNEKATIITTPWDRLTGKQFLSAFNKSVVTTILEDVCHHGHHHDGEECHPGHHHDGEVCHHEHHHDGKGCHHGHHHHAEDVFVSWGIETYRKFTKLELEDILSAFETEATYGTVLRAKGIVEDVEGNWLHFNYVPEETNVVVGPADYTGRICVIGVDLNTKRLQEVFS